MLGPTTHNDALQLSRIPGGPGNTATTVFEPQRPPHPFAPGPGLKLSKVKAFRRIPRRSRGSHSKQVE